MTTLSMPKERLRFVLLEGIHPAAVEVLHRSGYTNIEAVDRSLTGDESRPNQSKLLH